MSLRAPFQRTCREVTELVIAREDRSLPLRERMAVRMHMAVCAACPRFERQVFTMRYALRTWRQYAEQDDGTEVGQPGPSSTASR